MGGPGPGHKSERARLARLANMAKARAARKREPLRWRSGLESRIIEQLAWQWWLESSGKWLVASGWKNQVRTRGAGRFHRKGPPLSGVTHMHAAYANAAANKPASAGKPWAKQRVARFLGVSHTWVNKLVKRFEADPDRMRRRMAAFAPATLEKLERAREETRRQRELGWLRGPIQRRRVKWTVEGKTQRAIVWTHSERQRRKAGAKGRPEGPVCEPYADIPPWAKGMMLGGDGWRANRKV